MIYTVGEMAQKLGVPASTLRYYDKEGLLPFVERSSGGIRMFRENDFEWLQVIRCMKKAGMSIKDIRQYIELSMQGDLQPLEVVFPEHPNAAGGTLHKGK
jgi:DNA-binding transcriptional MerR regulator